MTKHEKKIRPEYFQAVLEGKKTYELRLADRACSEGDILLLKEWDPTTESYTSRELEKIVTYIVKTQDQSFRPPEEVEKWGFQVIGFADTTTV